MCSSMCARCPMCSSWKCGDDFENTWYRGTSFIKNSASLRPYGRTMLGPYGRPRGGGLTSRTPGEETRLHIIGKGIGQPCEGLGRSDKHHDKHP